MAELDVVRLHTGLQLHHGLDAGYLSDVSSTSSTCLLSPSGLPLDVGWFDSSKKSLPGISVYALTTYPEQPNNMHHRIILQQERTTDTMATLFEEDAADYLEGYDYFPNILRRVSLEQPEIDKTIRELTTGAYVLNATTGESHAKFAWNNAYDVQAVRDHGLSIINAGNVLAKIDDATLSRYAQIDPPILH